MSVPIANLVNTKAVAAVLPVPIAALVNTKAVAAVLPVPIAALVNTKVVAAVLPVPIAALVNTKVVAAVLPVSIMPQCVPPGHHKRRPPLPPRTVSVPNAASVHSKTIPIKLPVPLAALVNTKTKSVKLPVRITTCVPPGLRRGRFILGMPGFLGAHGGCPPLPPRTVSVAIVKLGNTQRTPVNIIVLQIGTIQKVVPPGGTKR